MDIAAPLGDLDTIKLLHHSGIKCCTVDAMNKAAAIGRIDIAEWLHIHRTEGCSENAITTCTMNGLSTSVYIGDVEMIKYLITIPVLENPHHSNGGHKTILMPSNLQPLVIFCGNRIDVVEILRDFCATTKAMDRAVSNGHFEMIKYLHIHRKEGCSTDAYSSAVKTNRLDNFKYLVINDCGRGSVDYEKLCMDAAGCNNIDMLQFCTYQIHEENITIFKQRMICDMTSSGFMKLKALVAQLRFSKSRKGEET
ncbi:hypothetical protein THRCLA_04314 [Thraustotheca clavata]|uniref:Uncharacterized protein n=1 Tax=Thraustotheca clavata TaxID=74557 RepID=A0A1V9ZZE3_9STRA|nr:hypothetical protein THRCLA_04314 [Thraustotheca clavata]